MPVLGRTEEAEVQVAAGLPELPASRSRALHCICPLVFRLGPQMWAAATHVQGGSPVLRDCPICQASLGTSSQTHPEIYFTLGISQLSHVDNKTITAVAKPKPTKTPENKDHPSLERLELPALPVGMQNAAASLGSRLSRYHTPQKSEE